MKNLNNEELMMIDGGAGLVLFSNKTGAKLGFRTAGSSTDVLALGSNSVEAASQQTAIATYQGTQATSLVIVSAK